MDGNRRTIRTGRPRYLQQLPYNGVDAFDFRLRALDIFVNTPPDVFNHNLETVPRLYRQARRTLATARAAGVL